MPHLTFEVSEQLDGGDVEPFADWVTERYAEMMDTGTGHVAVTVHDDATLAEGPLASWSVEEDDGGPPGIE
ncbi:MAG: hypothetical protein V5A39_08340 [Haloarculaceae archaeon]